MTFCEEGVQECIIITEYESSEKNRYTCALYICTYVVSVFNAGVNELVEFINAIPTFSKKDLIKFSDLELWERIWRHCLRVTALKTAAPPDMSPEIEKLVKRVD